VAMAMAMALSSFRRRRSYRPILALVSASVFEFRIVVFPFFQFRLGYFTCCCMLGIKIPLSSRLWSFECWILDVAIVGRLQRIVWGGCMRWVGESAVLCKARWS
jgi:hypothetical protein